MIQFFHHKLACDKINRIGGVGNHTVSRLVGEPGPGAVRFHSGVLGGAMLRNSCDRNRASLIALLFLSTAFFAYVLSSIFGVTHAQRNVDNYRRTGARKSGASVADASVKGAGADAVADAVADAGTNQKDGKFRRKPQDNV